MKLLLLALWVAVCPTTILAQAPSAQTPPHANAPASQEIQTETIGPPGQTPATPSTPTNSTGYLAPEQVKAWTHRIWLAQFRLNDLLTQVHPDKWKMSPATRQSFEQSLQSLHTAIAAEENWRSQFDARPDSVYLGFQTYMAISAVLPRVDGIAHSVAQFENPSFGGQYTQAANQLFDLQQLIEPHLAYLLKNQDDLLLATQTNLASCQHELNFAEHDKEGRATPMKNIAPAFKGHGRKAPAAAAPGAAKADAPKGTATGKPATNPPSPTPKK
jgi:hypothetical protein